MADRLPVERLRKGLGLRGLAARGARFLSRPDPRKVMWLNYAVTYLCNSRCLTCNIWKKYRETPEMFNRELTLAEVKKAFSGSRYLKHLGGVGLTGGEPFLRRDFVELAGFFIEQYPDALVSVATNGIETHTIVRKVGEITQQYRPKFFGLSLSLDGIGAAHDRARGVRDAYSAVTETLDALKAFPGVQVGVDLTITPDNYGEMLKVYEFARGRGLKFLTSFAHNSGAYYDNAGTDFSWNGPALERLDEQIRRLASAKVANESAMLKLVDPHAYLFLKTSEFARDGKRLFDCHSGTHSLFLDPYGNVYPCIILPEAIGNVRETDFDTLWMSPEAGIMRSRISRRECACWVPCEAVPSLMRSTSVIRWNMANKFVQRAWRRDTP